MCHTAPAPGAGHRTAYTQCQPNRVRPPTSTCSSTTCLLARSGVFNPAQTLVTSMPAPLVLVCLQAPAHLRPTQDNERNAAVTRPKPQESAVRHTSTTDTCPSGACACHRRTCMGCSSQSTLLGSEASLGGAVSARLEHAGNESWCRLWQAATSWQLPATVLQKPTQAVSDSIHTRHVPLPYCTACLVVSTFCCTPSCFCPSCAGAYCQAPQAAT